MEVGCGWVEVGLIAALALLYCRRRSRAGERFGLTARQVGEMRRRFGRRGG